MTFKKTIDNLKQTKPIGRQKTRIYLSVCISVALAFIIFLLLLNCIGIDTYIHDQKQIPTLREFYDVQKTKNETDVFFLGNSLIGASVYAPEINSILLHNGYNIKTYNLYLSSGTFNEYVLQLPDIIEAKPDLVVIGVSYSAFGNGSNSERLELFYDTTDLNDETIRLFSDSDLDAISTTLYPWDYKRFSFESIKYQLGIGDYTSNNYFIDPYGYDMRIRLDNRRSSDDAMIKASELYPWFHTYNRDTYAHKSLEYLTNELESNGINVVYVSLPINPYHLNYLSEIDEQDYHTYLNNSGISWYNIEKICDNPKYFYDHMHISLDGALKLASEYSDIIIKEMT